MKKRALLFLFLFVNGCALQSDLVDLQKDVDMLASQQKVIHQAVKGGRPAAVSQEKDNGKQLDILNKITQLEDEIKGMEGKWEEDNRLLSEMSQRMDQLSSKIGDLAGRTQSLEAGMSSFQKSEVNTGPDYRKESASSPSSAPVTETPSSQMIIPGRNITGSGNITSIEAFNLAYKDFVRGNYEVAVKGFDSFIRTFPSSSLVPQAQHWIGESFYEMKDHKKAISAFEKLISLYPDSDKVPTAMLKESYALLEIGNTSKSKEHLKQIIERYPYSKEAKLAKEKLAELR